jgi:hypothetical protein
MEYQQDLVVLVADKNMEFSMKGILCRPKALGINQIDFKVYRHPQKDPGCLLYGHNFLRPFANKFRNALIMLDRQGCGKENVKRKELETQLEERLSSSGWGNRAAAIVIDPELEEWLWSDSPEVDAALGWRGKYPSLREWLINKGFLKENGIKPSPPKEALEKALREVRKPRSSSIFFQIADKISLKRCQDKAFLKLKEKLIQWFGKGGRTCA